MNKIRRKNLQTIIDQLEDIKADLEEITSEEEEYRDNIPENLQSSEKYERADEACDNLNDAADTLNEVIDSHHDRNGIKKSGRPAKNATPHRKSITASREPYPGRPLFYQSKAEKTRGKQNEVHRYQPEIHR